MARHARRDITAAITGRRRARLEIAAAELDLAERLVELITADEPAEGVAAFERRLVDAWVEDIESAPMPEAGASP